MQNDPLALTLTQSFEIERMNRVIDECTNLEEIKSLTKQLVSAWHSQKAATAWVMRNQFSSPPRVSVDSFLADTRPGQEPDCMV